MVFAHSLAPEDHASHIPLTCVYAQAINALLSPTSTDTDTDRLSTPSPIRFEQGTVRNITTLIAWPLSRFDVVADEIELVFRVAGPTGSSRPPASASPSGSSRQNPPPGSQQKGHSSDHTEEEPLSESHVSLAIAHDFVSHELLPFEDAELRASLHLSPSQSIDLPGAFSGTPRVTGRPAAQDNAHVEDAEATMLAGVIEKLLGRLGVTAQGLRVRLLWSSSAGAGGEAQPTDHELELRVERIEFRGGDVAEDAQADSARPLLPTKRITVSPAKLYLHTRTARRLEASFSASQTSPERWRASAMSSSSSSASSASSSSEDEQDLLAMSQSVADLRTSVQSSGTSSRVDLFASATSQVFEPVIEQPDEEDHARPDSPFVDPDAKPRPRAPLPSVDDARVELLASIGVAEPMVVELSSRAATAASGVDDGAGVHIAGRLGDVIAVGIRPEHLRVLSDLANQFSTPTDRHAPSTTRPAPAHRSRAGTELSVFLPVIRVVVGSRYDSPIPDTFWNRTSAPVAIPHLRLCLEEIVLLVQPGHAAGFELSTKAVTATEVCVGDDGSLRVLPILVNDPNLCAPTLQAWPETDILSTDWVVNPQQQYGKDWRLLARVVADERKPTKSRPATGSAEENPTTAAGFQPAIRYRQTPRGAARLDLQSLHVFFDLAIFTRLDDLVHAVASGDEGSSTASRKQTTPPPRPESRHSATGERAGTQPAAITCPLLRISVRCPAPAPMRDAAQDDHLVRGGHLVLDMRAIEVTSRVGAQSVQAGDVRAYLAAGRASRARVFLAVSTLEGDGGSRAAYRPTLKFSSTDLGVSQPPRCDLDLPLLRVSLDKAIFDSIQLLADDLSQYVAKEVSCKDLRSDAQWSSNNKMIGSRFFGTKSYLHPKRRARGASWRGHESETDSIDSTATMTADDIRLAEPRAGQARGTDTAVRTTLLYQVTVTDGKATRSPSGRGKDVDVHRTCSTARLCSCACRGSCRHRLCSPSAPSQIGRFEPQC